MIIRIDRTGKISSDEPPYCGRRVIMLDGILFNRGI
jgi:hypothetical protein